jgi:hypothetical protein
MTRNPALPSGQIVEGEKTLPVQNMNLGFTEIHVLNGPIFGLHLSVSGVVQWSESHLGRSQAFCYVVHVLGHDGYA